MTGWPTDLLRWAPLLILAAGLVLRLVGLGSKSLWGDEAFSWHLALDEWPNLWNGGGNDPHHPPLYYAVLHLVIPLSAGEGALRIPSALASTATIGLTFLAAQRLSNSKVALVAAMLVAFSPLDVWYAQDARQAALATCLVALAAYGLTRRDKAGWAIATAGLTLGLFTYYVVAVAWMAILGVILALDESKAFIKGWLVATMVALAVFVPLQGAHFVHGYFDLQDAVAGSNSGILIGAVGSPYVILVLTAAAGYVGAVILRTVFRRNRFLAAGLVLVAFGAITLFAPVPRLYSLKRIAVVAWPLILVLVAVAIWHWLPGRFRKASVVVALAVSLAASLVSLSIEKDDWRGGVAAINRHAAHDDTTWVVVYSGNWAVAPYRYYDLRTPLVHEADPANYPSLADSVPGDLWIVASRTPRDPVPSSGPEAWLDENWLLAETHDLHRLAVRRYSPP